MRSYSHITGRYITDRLADFWFRTANPDLPWLTRDAIVALDSLLWPSDIGIEFGSGRSTVWLASRIRHLVSIERRPNWYGKVSEEIAKKKLTNVDYRLVGSIEGDIPDYKTYLMAIDEARHESLDFALIDDIYRDECILRVIPKIRAGGFLILDNVNWHLPCNSRAPDTRRIGEGPSPEGSWREVHRQISGWRVLWSSSGVADTAIFFKPHEQTQNHPST